MTIAALSNIFRAIGGGLSDEDNRNALLKEALLMTLARATSADSNINPVEVETVREIVKKSTGEDVSVADVRVAARSELFERTTLERCLGRIGQHLSADDRELIARSLAEVIKSDVRVTEREIEFFDRISGALKVSPAQLVGLSPERQ